MIERIHVTAIVGVAIAALAIALWLGGEPPSLRWLGSIGAPVAVVFGALTLFNLLLWKVPLLQGWFVKRPHLWGRWRVQMQSHWIDPRTGQRPAPFEVTWTVRQTFLGLYIHQEGQNATGDLVVGRVLRKEDGTYQIAGIYKGEPTLDQREQSPIHYGAILLDVQGSSNKPASMRGHYWTDRNTKGEIVAAGRQKVHG